ncbi:hypothetical protein [Xanthocytophaga agilis]|uniref:Uncharacterized protein n=1 Tax=Xanthocytophaga agilis TaxID=3048010 RepID=A0AAE3R6Z3_9BACT|nr:hypothetical protein [Xanthocytophaga agilis]MDJ1502737.1 hypothetical protein [Xanthocytophaga agilis]
MQRHTLTISDAEGCLIDLHICTHASLAATDGFWVTDVNYVLLGSERWAEWNELYGHNDKQTNFLSKVKRVSTTEVLT